MLKPPHSRLQPSYYGAFRCVGSACEDNCCSGWRVPVDKNTFQKYQECTEPSLGSKLQALVTISAHPESDESYAEIRLNQGMCPFLTEGLCEIHAKLGETLLSKNCATYPRALAELEDGREYSLHLSCPEAARLALVDPEPMQFVSLGDAAGEECAGSVGFADSPNSKHNVVKVRSRMIALLQDRSLELADRLRTVGQACAELEGAGKRANAPPPPGLSSTARFETVVELILARIGSDATGRRFLDCYQAFMRGLNWVGDSTLEQLAKDLDAAFAGPFSKFQAEHGHMLEHYLVNYVFKSIFPFGTVSANRKLAENGFVNSFVRQYQLLIVLFVSLQSLMAGAAAHYGEDFGVALALRLIQSFSKTFEHSVAYPGKALRLLAEKGFTDYASTSTLLR